MVHGWLNLGSGAGEIRDHATAETSLREAIAVAADRDLDAHQHYATAWLSRVRLERGDWTEAADLIDRLPLESPHLSPTTAIVALGLWRRRAGIDERLPEVAAEPYALHATGRLGQAAEAWEALDCPYEAADALGDSDRPADLRRALGILDRLGAAAAAAPVRARLRELGVRNIPRGPRPATAANPAGLTPRQAQVLALVATGLRDADIAERLHLSPKTVGHHVSAILDKLAVSSRSAAVHRARELGALPPDG